MEFALGKLVVGCCRLIRGQSLNAAVNGSTLGYGGDKKEAGD